MLDDPTSRISLAQFLIRPSVPMAISRFFSDVVQKAALSQKKKLDHCLGCYMRRDTHWCSHQVGVFWPLIWLSIPVKS